MGLFKFGKSNNAYLPGCTLYYKYPEIFDLYKKIFSKLKIDFRVLEKQFCCGLPALEAGYDAEARKIFRNNFDKLKEEGIKEVITTSPDCYKAFLKNYPETIPDWDIGIKNVWEIIAKRLEAKPKLIKMQAMELVTYHDSCYLGRYCDVYEEPRKILRLIGYEVKEMIDNHENSLCCGSCGGLSRTNPGLADKIARERILQAKRLKVKKMIVCSLDNYQLLKKNSYDEVEILELAEVLALALGIKKKQRDEPEEEILEEEQSILDSEANRKLEEELKGEEFYESVAKG